MTEMSKLIQCARVASKADAVLAAVRQGHRRIDAIAATSGLAPTTVVRVAALLRDHRKIDRLHGSGVLELLPIFQRSASEG